MTITLCAGDSRCEYLGLKDHTLDEIRNLCCLDNGRHRPIPKYALGALEQLPLEIIHMVLIQLDIRSLTDFRHVNQRALQVVDSIPQYISSYLLLSATVILAADQNIHPSKAPQ